MNFLKTLLAGLLGGLVVVLGSLLFQSQSLLGGTSNFNTVDADTSFTISGTTVIDSSRNITNAQNVAGKVVTASSSLSVGSAKASIEEIHCIQQTVNLPTVLLNATATFGFAFAGVETSTNQVYIFSVSSSSAPGTENKVHGLNFVGTPTSTAGSLEVTIKPEFRGIIATVVPLKACYIQF